MAAKPQCRGKVEKRNVTWCSLNVALHYLVAARIITGPFLPQVWKIKYFSFVSGVREELKCLISAGSRSSYLSHCCFVGNVAGFLTWTRVWRGQPGDDPHLQLWLLPQRPPDITKHTPAAGEREKVWQLLAQVAGEERMRKKGGMERIKK